MKVKKKKMPINEILKEARILAEEVKKSGIEFEYICRVCGFKHNIPIWEKIEENFFPSYEICCCCSAQFGLDDDHIISIREFRKNWINDGAKFALKKMKPKPWNYDEQIKMIPEQWK